MDGLFTQLKNCLAEQNENNLVALGIIKSLTDDDEIKKQIANDKQIIKAIENYITLAPDRSKNKINEFLNQLKSGSVGSV